jgi:hypothetical protein
LRSSPRLQESKFKRKEGAKNRKVNKEKKKSYLEGGGDTLEATKI